MDIRAARSTLSLLAGVAAAASFSAPATAASFSKTEAILGGPSALEALIAQQNGQPITARPAFAPKPASLAYARPQILPAILRDSDDSKPAVSPGVTNGRPDIFGTVALRVGHTSLDGKWRRVEHSPVTGAAARFAQSQRGKEAKDRLEAVNWYVNRRVHFVDDSVAWGRADVWSAADETLNRGRGDCEDYAIAKLAMARRAGFADRDLYLVILRDTVRRADHAVLVVRAAGHMYVLDNGTDELLDSESVDDYRPIFSFAMSGGEWIHGYRVQQPQAPVNIASAEIGSIPGARLGLR
jgi:predicted transglutaminase-like cysteine proteinase